MSETRLVTLSRNRAGDARRGILERLWPGLLLTLGIAAVATGLHYLPGIGLFNAAIIAALIGMAVRAISGLPAATEPGVAFSQRHLLRLSIVLLGLQLTLSQVAALGLAGVVLIAAVVLATFLFTRWLGRVLGVEPGLAELIAAGTAICGASAVVAANSVTRAGREDVAYAIACVTVFGSAAMLLYPLLPHLLALTPHDYGLWAGASIHEIAQVFAAVFQAGGPAGETGIVAKLGRVILLAPMLIVLAIGVARRGAEVPGPAAAAPLVPLFVVGFIAMVIVNSVLPVPVLLKQAAAAGATFLLTTALAALGLGVEARKLKAKGMRPLALAAAAWCFIAVLSLALIKAVDLFEVL